MNNLMQKVMQNKIAITPVKSKKKTPTGSTPLKTAESFVAITVSSMKTIAVVRFMCTPEDSVMQNDMSYAAASYAMYVCTIFVLCLPRTDLTLL